MYQGFADRAKAVRELLQSADSAFLVVAAPEADPLAQALVARRPAAATRASRSSAWC